MNFTYETTINYVFLAVTRMCTFVAWLNAKSQQHRQIDMRLWTFLFTIFYYRNDTEGMSTMHLLPYP